MKKLIDIIWSFWAASRAIRKHGLDKALSEVRKELHSGRMKYWKVTGKHPDSINKGARGSHIHRMGHSED